MDKSASVDLVEINGKRFLKCNREDCQWNLRYVSGTEKARVCNYGVFAFSVKGEMPKNCPHLVALSSLITTELLEQSLRDDRSVPQIALRPLDGLG